MLYMSSLVYEPAKPVPFLLLFLHIHMYNIHMYLDMYVLPTYVRMYYVPMYVDTVGYHASYVMFLEWL